MKIKLLALFILVNAFHLAHATDYYLAGSASGTGTGLGGWGNAANAQAFFTSLQGNSLPISTHIYIKSCSFSFMGSPPNFMATPIYLNNNDILIQGGFPTSAIGTDISGYNPVSNPVSISLLKVMPNSVLTLFKSDGTGISTNIVEVKGLKFGNNQGCTIFGGGLNDGGIYRFTGLQVTSSTSPNGLFLLGGFTKGGSAVFQNCEFDFSPSLNGGASIINGGSDIPISVTNCSFASNYSSSTASIIGNGVISTSYPGIITISNSGFCSNVDASSANITGGGAIACLGGNYVTLNISGCTFKSNSTLGGGGGAIYCNNGTINISNSLFLGNSTASTTLGGGAIFLAHSAGGNIINNCIFYNNNCSNNVTVGNGSVNGSGGGAINIGYDNKNFTISNSEFVSNFVGSGSTGGAIVLYNDQGTNAKIKDCLFRGNNIGNTTSGNNTTVGSDIITHSYGVNSGILTIDTDSLQLAGQASYKDFTGLSNAGYAFQGSNIFNNSIDHVGSPTYTCPTFSQTVILPINITDFTAIKTNNGNQLIWVADNAVNFSHFIVQRKNQSGVFTTIGIVNFGNAYSFTDENPITGVNYYRLEMIDKDGSVQYSKIVTVVNSPTDSFSISVYPMPTKNIINVSFHASTSGRMIFDIFDLSGKKVKQTYFIANLGDNKYQFDINSLPVGIYLAKIKYIDGSLFSFKILKE